MDYALYLRALLSLCFVLGLLLVCFWALKRLHLFQGGIGPARTRRLRVIETLAIDGRNRAVLLKQDGQEHLIAIGPSAITLLASTASQPPIEDIAP